MYMMNFEKYNYVKDKLFCLDNKLVLNDKNRLFRLDNLFCLDNS